MEKTKFVQTKVSKELYKKLRIQAAKTADGFVSKGLKQAIQQYTAHIKDEDEL